ncbi:MAG: hypothetical protein ACQETM_10985 [Bacteroidota bacterium]
MMNTRYCLVLGSKPGAPLPDVEPAHIFTANAAAALISQYSQTSAPHTAVVSSLQYKNMTVFEKVVHSKPDEIVIRGHKKGKNPQPVDDIPVIYLPGKEQFRLETRYFGISNYRAFLLRPGINKLKAAIRHIQGVDYIFGSSTGLWTVLYALDRYPDHTIIVAGVGLQGGAHFYGKDEFRNEDGIKDYLIAGKLSPKARKRVRTTDENFAERTGVSMWDGPVLNKSEHQHHKQTRGA